MSNWALLMVNTPFACECLAHPGETVRLQFPLVTVRAVKFDLA